LQLVLGGFVFLLVEEEGGVVLILHLLGGLADICFFNLGCGAACFLVVVGCRTPKFDNNVFCLFAGKALA
jgi:hypothetical protein